MLNARIPPLPPRYLEVREGAAGIERLMSDGERALSLLGERRGGSYEVVFGRNTGSTVRLFAVGLWGSYRIVDSGRGGGGYQGIIDGRVSPVLPPLSASCALTMRLSFISQSFRALKARSDRAENLLRVEI